VNIERETKLAVGPGFRLPGLADLHGGVHAEPSEPARTHTTYWDTEDLRLARWGVSLRFREGQGWTLKLPDEEDHGEATVREEIVFPGDPARLPFDAADLVRAYVRGGTLRPVARLRTIRSRLALVRADGSPAGEVVDDEVSVLDGRRIAARFRELEVETADEALGEAAVARLRAAGAGGAIHVTKVLRALGPRAQLPPDLVAAPSLPSDATVEQVVRNALCVSAIRLIRNDAGVRIGEDPEALHRMRVATRRLRSDLRTFRSLLDPEWTAALREELAWLADALGAVRDLDVLEARLAGHVPELPDTDVPAARRLVARVQGTRRGARSGLLEGLRSPRYVTLLDDVVGGANDPAVLAEARDLEAREAMGALMAGPWGHLREAIDAIGPDSPDEALHAARIRSKRVRYAADALAPVFGKRAAAFDDAAGALQDVLGEHQDSVVAAAWLRGAAQRARPMTAFAAGLLAAREEDARSASRSAWHPAWEALRRKKLRFWT
jgi:CHAD domain-containing protein